MTTRTVTGTLHHTPDTAWIGASVVFVLTEPFADSSTFPPERITATTDSNGQFSQALAVPSNSAAAARYACELPNGVVFEFVLTTGVGSVTLESLLVQALTSAEPNSLQALIDAHAAIKAGSAQLGHVRVGDTTIVIDGNGVISVAADSITYAKIQNVSTTDRVLGRATSGAGDIEEITFTAAARSLVDDADTTAMRVTLEARQAIADGRMVVGGVTQYGVPGVELTSVSTFALSANQVRYAPFLVVTPITIDQLAIEVTAAGAGGTTARIALYAADTSWGPASLIVDAGTVAIDSPGVKAANVNVVLQPGRYFTAVNTDGAPTLRAIRGGGRFSGIASTIGASPLNVSLFAAQTYGVFPGTGTAISNATNSTVPTNQTIFLRVSTP